MNHPYTRFPSTGANGDEKEEERGGMQGSVSCNRDGKHGEDGQRRG